jgi:hypothetical protein
MPSTAAADAAKAAKSAHRAMVFTLFAVAVAIAVLAIDNSIKRSIVEEARQVREIFRQFQEATDGIKAAVQSRADNSPPDGPPDPGSSGVADDPRTRPAPSGDANSAGRATARSKGGSRAGP